MIDGFFEPFARREKLTDAVHDRTAVLHEIENAVEVAVRLEVFDQRSRARPILQSHDRRGRVGDANSPTASELDR